MADQTYGDRYGSDEQEQESDEPHFFDAEITRRKRSADDENQRHLHDAFYSLVEALHRAGHVCGSCLWIRGKSLFSGAFKRDHCPGQLVAGMPVLEVWNAKNVIVFKRSMAAGYAGVQNPLFFRDNSSMLFGDAKERVDDILRAL